MLQEEKDKWNQNQPKMTIPGFQKFFKPGANKSNSSSEEELLKAKNTLN